MPPEAQFNEATVQNDTHYYPHNVPATMPPEAQFKKATVQNDPLYYPHIVPATMLPETFAAHNSKHGMHFNHTLPINEPSFHYMDQRMHPHPSAGVGVHPTYPPQVTLNCFFVLRNSCYFKRDSHRLFCIFF